jgi:trypsin
MPQDHVHLQEADGDEPLESIVGDDNRPTRKNLRERALSFSLDETFDLDDVTHQGIVGGQVVTDMSRYPFFVGGGGCGGTLIGNDIVITAAHCNGAFWKRAKVGPRKNAKNKDGLTEWVKVVSKMHVHPNFSWDTMENDFMIFKVKPVTSQPLISALNQQKVTLNFDSAVPVEDEWLTTIGFGLTAEDGNPSKQLREVSVQVIPSEECSIAYDGAVYNETQLCAGVDEGGKDACQGDSGGPILATGNVLVGIVSWGYGCAEAEYPGVYSRVSSAASWIKETICTLSDSPPFDSCE